MVKKQKAKGEIPSILRRYMDLDNIAPELDSQTLTNIASEVIESVQQDDESRYEWVERYNEAMKIAKQISSGKNTPWQGAADVKIPLLLAAAIQHNARMLPEIIQGTKIVKIADMNPEAGEAEEERNDRIANHMSWQMLEQIPNWRSDTDKLLMALSLIGVVYRKTHFDSIEKKPAVDFCLPSDIVINNNVVSLRTAERVTHILHLLPNDLWEKMKAEIYIDYPIEKLEGAETKKVSMNGDLTSEDKEESTDYHEIYEQHTFYDLDNDGYKEPYIITVHKKSSLVLRIVARYQEDSFIFANKAKSFVKIIPKQYFSDYHFIPSPDGTFHSMGFGQFLYPLNEASNTIVNQLLDAGTLQNTAPGFVASSVRMSPEPLQFKIGEIKKVKVPQGTTLQQNLQFVPIPGPSPVLLELLSFIMKNAQELASITDVMQGQAPGANTPATTVMSMVEQGSKVYSAMLHRLYFSFKKEFEKLFEINKEYMDIEESFNLGVQAQMITLEDYQQANVSVFPVADPGASSDTHRMMRAEALMKLIEMPGVDKGEVIKRYIEALKVPHPEKILPPPDPNAPPPIQEQLAEAELKFKNMQVADILMKRELEALGMNIRQEEVQVDAAFKGGQISGQKIDAIAKLAQTDAIVGEKAVSQAQKQAEMMQTPITPDLAQSTQQQLTGLEATLGRQVGSFPSGAGNLPAPQAASMIPGGGGGAQPAAPQAPAGAPGQPPEA